ncbi:MAG: hypothetical protein FH748_08015 [Balneolaceae bacterium]|nr:hypothetical protein [Balneolaceae bacterium]
MAINTLNGDPMHNVRVQFTVPNVEDVVNLDVLVNGEKRHLRFRVETFGWDAEHGSTEDLISILRKRIMNYDSDWELYHIGSPYEDCIPVTFRYKS